MSTDPKSGRAPKATSAFRGARSIFAVVLLAGGSLALAACPGSLENKEAFTSGGGCGDTATKIVGARCATSNCHDADQPQSGIDMTPDAGLASRLVGVPGDLCSGFLIDPNNPDQSLMYTKCLATNSCNARMPFSGAKLTTEEEQCLLDWVTELAGEATGVTGATTSSTAAGTGGAGGAAAGGGGAGG